VSDVTTQTTYWQEGNGDPYTGGAFGADVAVLVGEVVLSKSTSRPDGAQTITEVEHAALEAAFRATWDERAVGGAAWLAAHEAEVLALRDSARGKLIAGQALTAAEAAAITGT